MGTLRNNPYFAAAEPVDLDAVLLARDRRAGIQRDLLEKYHRTLISYTMNIPGEYKRYPLQEEAFDEGIKQIKRQLSRNRIPVLFETGLREPTGCEAFYVVDGDAAAVKHLLMQIEEGHGLGRFFRYGCI